MAKAKPATEIDFSDAPVEAAEDLKASQQESIDAIRARRAKARALVGQKGAKRRITNYHDAERLARLAPKFPHLVSNEEIVDCEEAGLLPNRAHYYSSDGPAFEDGFPKDGE